MNKVKSLEALVVETCRRHRRAVVLCAVIAAAGVAVLLLLLCAPSKKESAHAAEAIGPDALTGTGMDGATGDYALAAKQELEAANDDMTKRMEEIYEYLVQLDGMVTDNQTTLEEVRKQADADQKEGESVGEMQEQLKGDVVTLGTRMSDLHESINKTKELLTQMKESVEKGQTTNYENTIDRMKEIENSITVIDKEFNREIEELGGMIALLMKQMEGDSASRYESTMQTLTTMKEQMETAQKESLSSMTEKLEKLQGDYAQSLQHVQELLTANAEQLGKQMENMGKDLNGRMDNVETGVNEKIGKMDDGLKDRMNNMESGIGGKLADVESGVNSKIGQMDDGINNRMNSMENGIGGKLADVESGVNSKIGEMGDGINDRMNSMETGVNTKIGQMDDGLNNRMNSMESGIGNKLTDVENGVNTEIGKMNEGFGDKMNDVKSSIGDKLAGVQSDIGRQLTGAQSEITTNINSVNNSLNTMNAGMDERLRAIENKLDTSFTSVSNGKRSVADALLTKNIPVTMNEDNPWPDGETPYFGDITNAIRAIRSPSDESSGCNLRISDYGSGDNAPTWKSATSAPVAGILANGEYRMKLGVRQTVTLPSGYYDKPVSVSNAIKNRGDLNKTLAAGGSVTLSEGYYTGGTVTAKDLSSQTPGNAGAGQILTGYSAWVNGSQVNGSMANRGKLNWKPAGKETLNVAAGYYSGGTLDSSDAYDNGFNAGYTKGKADMEVRIKNASIVYTVHHQHTGNSTDGGGCYTKVVSSTEVGGEHNLVGAEVPDAGEPDGFYKFCTYCNQYVHIGADYPCPGNPRHTVNVYDVDCGLAEGDRTVTDLSSLRGGDTVTGASVSY